MFGRFFGNAGGKEVSGQNGPCEKQPGGLASGQQCHDPRVPDLVGAVHACVMHEDCPKRRMTELLTAAQMRAIEQAAIDSGEVTGLELMERAGRGVVEAIFEEWPELKATSHRTVVLCGPGNNGGDGFVVARLLKEWGWEVEVFLYGDADKLPPDARVDYERWLELGAAKVWNDDVVEDCLDESEHELVVDALFGTGLKRPMPDDMERIWHAFMPRVYYQAEAERPKYVAVDLQSGRCSDSGRDMEGELPTDLSVTFHSAKVGHFLSAQAGSRISVKDIGLEGLSLIHI